MCTLVQKSSKKQDTPSRRCTSRTLQEISLVRHTAAIIQLLRAADDHPIGVVVPRIAYQGRPGLCWLSLPNSFGLVSAWLRRRCVDTVRECGKLC